MRLAIVQLSDTHLQAYANPVEARLSNLVQAVGSIQPHADACLVLATGDIAYSGESGQYERAASFFDSVRSSLEELFGAGNVVLDYIPGNHDCFLPTEEATVREALVAAARPVLDRRSLDAGYVSALSSPQSAFNAFYSRMTGRTLTAEERIVRCDTHVLAGKHVRVLSFNTALLSQRHEKPGQLYLPRFALEACVPSQQPTDMCVAVYHHPSNWLEPDFRRDFLRSVESAAHIVFTGHEHQHDDHWTESSSGEHTAYIEADALQDKTYPRTSGFNCLLVDFEKQEQRYYHFRWKADHYSAVINGAVHTTTFSEKTLHRFEVTARFSSFLTYDDFGFTHPRKNDLRLQDFFTYPPLQPNDPSGKNTTITSGNAVPVLLLGQRSVYLQGQERGGKTALLKTFYKHVLANTTRVPVYLTGDRIPTTFDEPLFSTLDSAVRTQYGDSSVERFRQLPIERKVLFIDDFHALPTKAKARASELVHLLRKHFGLLLVASSQLPMGTDLRSEVTEEDQPFTSALTIRELSPSSRADIIGKWLRLGTGDNEADDALIREAHREEAFLSDLIRRRALPSLPYLVLGVLQIRHNKKEDLVDPGSFGYLFQRLVIDALSVTSSKAHVDRKEGILRRFAFLLHSRETDGASRDDFDFVIGKYAEEVQIRVDAQAIFEDLVKGKVLQDMEGFVSFRHRYFFHYFVARQLLDGVDSDHPENARAVLNAMAERPLIAANQLTLMFFLFFKKRDPIIDGLLEHADRVFSGAPLTDIASDVHFIDTNGIVLKEASVDEKVDLKAEAEKRLTAEDCAEQRQLARIFESDHSYSDDLGIALKYRFALARIELLGQVIRSFSGSLDGAKKQQILDTVFRLGLRSLHSILESLEPLSKYISEQVSLLEDTKERRQAEQVFKQLIAFLGRIYSDSSLIHLSRAVGVSDIETSYERAIRELGDTCATQLLELAIKLDHSETFPFALLKATRVRLAAESTLASQVLTDLVARHVHIVPHQRETLKRIAQTLNLDTKALIATQKA